MEPVSWAKVRPCNMAPPRSPLRVLLPTTLMTLAASAVWSVALLRLVDAGRVGLVGMLLAGELLGSLLSIPARHLSPTLRFRLAVLGYCIARSALVPLLTASHLTQMVLATLAGGCWRLLSAQVSVAALTGAQASERSTRLAHLSVFSMSAALTGSLIASIAFAFPTAIWSAGSLLIAAAIFIPVDRTHRTARPAAMSRRIAAVSVLPTFTVHGFQMLAPATIALLLSPRWVPFAATLALLASLTAPRLAPYTDRLGLDDLSVVMFVVPMLWIAAALAPPLAVLVWPLVALVAALIDAQLDARSVTGSDPAASAATVQSSQAVAAAAASATLAAAYDWVGVLYTASFVAGVAVCFVLLRFTLRGR